MTSRKVVDIFLGHLVLVTVQKSNGTKMAWNKLVPSLLSKYVCEPGMWVLLNIYKCGLSSCNLQRLINTRFSHRFTGRFSYLCETILKYTFFFYLTRHNFFVVGILLQMVLILLLATQLNKFCHNL